ncbi:MAG: hypothetical protein LIP01_04945 [Tannerellaceae bacterium]|nr:hypothetical protein [Tannerellaceae bacterium]
MKIIHSSGEPYDISPDTTLEMERTNPFFNEYGEQSLPITLPPTARNRKLLSWPDDITGITKLTQRADATIQTGLFSFQARQAILSRNKKEGISTSFYLNTGAFYEKIQDVKLSTIFEKKSSSSTPSLQQSLFAVTCSSITMNASQSSRYPPTTAQ